MKKGLFALTLGLLLALPFCCAFASLPVFTGTIIVLSPGASSDIPVDMPEEGPASLVLMGEDAAIYTIASAFPAAKGTNEIPWNGLTTEGQPVPQGEYVLSVYMDELQAAKTSAQPADEVNPEEQPLLADVKQSTDRLTSRGIGIDFVVREPGLLTIQLQAGVDSASAELMAMQVGAGKMGYQWEGLLEGTRVPIGPYTITVSLATEQETQTEEIRFFVLPVSEPYSDVQDGTFWSMTPGEIDDAVIWDILMQPIYVWNNHEMHPSGHVYLMENPDGTGKRIAQIHARSQGLHVLTMPNEHGYVLAEAFSNYDPVFKPRKAEEIENAFAIKQGYIAAEHLKLVEVSEHIGFVVDKLTQRMYLFMDGKRVTEFLISTGSPAGGKIYRETIPGEFITVSYVGTFMSNDVYSDMAIRYNGGSLIHEVPYEINANGRRNFVPFERKLGTKASAGCVRVQRVKNADGYNMEWIWDTLYTGVYEQPSYKVIIWDDLNREDRPAVWYPTPTYEK